MDEFDAWKMSSHTAAATVPGVQPGLYPVRVVLPGNLTLLPCLSIRLQCCSATLTNYILKKRWIRSSVRCLQRGSNWFHYGSNKTAKKGLEVWLTARGSTT